MKIKMTPMKLQNNGFTVTEILVGLGITVGVLSVLAFLSSQGSLTRGGIEKKTESFQMATNIISKLYDSSLSDIDLICRSKGALAQTVVDPCPNIMRQSKETPRGLATNVANPLVNFLDSKINITTMQNSNATASPTISCLHINTCKYLISSSLIEVQLTYHWYEPALTTTQSRRLSFRRGVR